MGYTRVTVNAAASIWVGFQCQKCKKINLTSQDFFASEVQQRGGTLHTNKTLTRMEEVAAENAREKVQKEADKVLRAVEEKRFSGSGLSCVCAYCGEKQYWSGYGMTKSEDFPVVCETAAKAKAKMHEKGWLLSDDYAKVIKKNYNQRARKREFIKLITKILLLVICSIHAITNFFGGMYEWMITGFFALVLLFLTIAGIVRIVREDY